MEIYSLEKNNISPENNFILPFFEDDSQEDYSEIDDHICINCGDYVEKPKFIKRIGGPYCNECFREEIEDIIYKFSPWFCLKYNICNNLAGGLGNDDDLVEDMEEEPNYLWEEN